MVHTVSNSPFMQTLMCWYDTSVVWSQAKAEVSAKRSESNRSVAAEISQEEFYHIRSRNSGTRLIFLSENKEMVKRSKREVQKGKCSKEENSESAHLCSVHLSHLETKAPLLLLSKQEAFPFKTGALVLW